MYKIIADILMYIFESLILIHYSTTLFEPRKSKFISIIFTLIANTILCIIYQYGVVYINGISLIILYILMFYFLYKTTLKSAIFHSAIFIIIMFASEILIMAIGTVFFKDFNAMDYKKNAYLFVIITSKLLFFVLVMIVMNFFARKENIGIYNKYYWLLFFIPMSSILMLLSFRYIAYSFDLTDTIKLLASISSILILFSNILVFIIYEYSIKNTKELYDLKAIQHQEEQDRKYFDVIQQSNKEMQVFAHDIKNHLTQIRNIDNIKDVQNYIDKLTPNIDRFSYTGISKNKMLDLIISKYMTLCESKNIRFEVDVKTANLNYIDDVDLSTLLNNLLDNAIEAAEKTKNGYIQVKIFSKNNLHDGLVIKNSCINHPKSESGKLITTKLNKNLHGIGVKSINKVIKKYNAVYLWKYIEAKKIFETDIVFSKE